VGRLLHRRASSIRFFNSLQIKHADNYQFFFFAETETKNEEKQRLFLVVGTDTTKQKRKERDTAKQKRDTCLFASALSSCNLF